MCLFLSLSSYKFAKIVAFVSCEGLRFVFLFYDLWRKNLHGLLDEVVRRPPLRRGSLFAHFRQG